MFNVLISSEIKKNARAPIIIILAALLVLSAAVCYIGSMDLYKSGETSGAFTEDQKSEIVKFDKLYSKDTEKINSLYLAENIKYGAALEEYYRMIDEHTKMYEDTCAEYEAKGDFEGLLEFQENFYDEVLNTPFEYKTGSTLVEGVDDFELMLRYFLSCNNYRDSISEIVSKADELISGDSILQKYGGNRKMTDYQLFVKETYASALEKDRAPYRLVRGWDMFLSNAGGILVSLVAAVFISVSFALSDSESGQDILIRSTVRGRKVLGFYKLICAFALSLLWLAAEKTVEFGVILYKYGFSDPFVSVRNIPDFTLCPYDLTIAETALIMLLANVAAVLFTAALTFLFAVILRRSVFAHIAGYIVIAFELLLYWSIPVAWLSLLVSKLGALRLFDLFNLASGDLLKKTADIDSYKYGTTLFIPVLAVAVVLFIVISVFAFILYGLRKPSIKRSGRRAKAQLSKVKKKRGIKKKAAGLFIGEFYKLNIYICIIAAILLLVGVDNTIKSSKAEITESDKQMQKYYTTYGGEMSEERFAGITEYKALLESTQTEEYSQKLIESMINKQISAEDYYAMLSNVKSIKENMPLFDEFYSHAKSVNDYGKGGELFWYKDIQNFFESGFDTCLYIFMIFLCSFLFVPEFRTRFNQSAFANVMRTTARGRRDAVIAKLSFAAGAGLLTGVISLLFPMITLFKTVDTALFDAPLRCIPSYSGFIDISVRGYIVLFVFTRMVLCVLLALISLFMSGIFKNYAAALSVSVLITALPHFLYYYGIGIMGYADMLGALSVDGVLRLSFDNTHGIAFPGFVLAISAFTVYTGYVSVKGFTNSGRLRKPRDIHKAAEKT